MTKDTAFEFIASPVRFGPRVTREVGMDLADAGVARVLVVADPNLTGLEPVKAVLESLEANRVRFVMYDRVSIEPTDRSWREAIAFAGEHPFDAIAPVGKALPVPGALKPLMAIPTTAGTGSETTGVAIFDHTSLHVKTGVSNRRLKLTLGYLDPENTRTMPREVAASSGLDILCHAV